MKRAARQCVVVLVAALLVSCGGYEAAQKAYALGEYGRAAKLFDKVQRGEGNKSRRAEECFLLGECYRRLGMDSKAASAYQRAVRLRYDDDMALLRLADTYRALGKFDEADEAYNAYADRHKADLRAGVGRESAAMARREWKELNPRSSAVADSGYVVKPFREANSKYSDFCPAFVGEGFDVVYFSSMRMQKKKKRESRITGQGSSTLYMTRVDARGRWTVPEPLEDPFGQKGMDDGAAYVSPDGRTMLFTRCPLADAGVSPAQTFEMTREGGRWSEPVRVTPGGDSTMMVAHPALSPDGHMLYFVSDREEGGIGGLDLWRSLRNVDGSWGPAQNLGPMVNTRGDEMFPCVRQDGTLYFSSDGHKGYGGLDLFRAAERDDGRFEVVNMGIPINSTGDDFGIAFMGTAEEGFFSSNRGNAKGYDDIYSFYLPPVILTVEASVGQSGKKAFQVEPKREAESGAARSEAAGAPPARASRGAGRRASARPANAQARGARQPAFRPAPDAFVRVVGSDGTNVKLRTGADGKVSFVAGKDVHYIILAGAPGFANKRAELSTEGLNKTQTLSVVALLDKVE